VMLWLKRRWGRGGTPQGKSGLWMWPLRASASSVAALPRLPQSNTSVVAGRRDNVALPIRQLPACPALCQCWLLRGELGRGDRALRWGSAGPVFSCSPGSRRDHTKVSVGTGEEGVTPGLGGRQNGPIFAD